MGFIFCLIPSPNFTTLTGHWTKRCLGHVWCLGRSWTSTVSTGGWEWIGGGFCPWDVLLILLKLWGFGNSWLVAPVLHALESSCRSCFTFFLALFDVMLAIQIPIYVYWCINLNPRKKSWWNQRTPAAHSAPLPSTILGGAMSEVLLKGLRLWVRNFHPSKYRNHESFRNGWGTGVFFNTIVDRSTVERSHSHIAAIYLLMIGHDWSTTPMLRVLSLANSSLFQEATDEQHRYAMGMKCLSQLFEWKDRSTNEWSNNHNMRISVMLPIIFHFRRAFTI